jgi:PAS domain S-box-containing protein
MDERVLAQALRESEELHRVTLLSMSDAVFITTDDGAFTFVCPNVDVIFGYREDEVRAMERISRLLGSDLIELGHLASTGEVKNIEHEIETKSGTRRVLLVHVKRVSIRRGTILYVCRDITERKEADYAHRRSEERLRLALEAAKAATWDWDVPTGEMSWSPDTHRMFGDATSGRSPSLDSFLNCVHPLDRESVAATIREAMAGATSYETQFRVVGDDQSERWVLGKGRAFRNGKPLRMLGVFVDVSDRHRVEEERRDLGGRLINAHEEERRRLSRELHDGVGQRLALMSVELARLRKEVTGSPPILEQVRRLSEHIEEVGSELHRLSHELHPAWLEQLGLAASLRRICSELSDAGGITILLEIEEIPVVLTNEVALAVYRIAQEALHNIVKHSRARNSTVRLEADRDDIVLSVIDDGLGFDPLADRAMTGVGLISMRERVGQVDGQMTLTSKPNEGTRIEVRVPLLSAGI